MTNNTFFSFILDKYSIFLVKKKTKYFINSKIAQYEKLFKILRIFGSKNGQFFETSMSQMNFWPFSKSSFLWWGTKWTICGFFFVIVMVIRRQALNMKGMLTIKDKGIRIYWRFLSLLILSCWPHNNSASTACSALCLFMWVKATGEIMKLPL